MIHFNLSLSASRTGYGAFFGDSPLLLVLVLGIRHVGGHCGECPLHFTKEHDATVPARNAKGNGD